MIMMEVTATAVLMMVWLNVGMVHVLHLRMIVQMYLKQSHNTTLPMIGTVLVLQEVL